MNDHFLQWRTSGVARILRGSPDFGPIDAREVTVCNDAFNSHRWHVGPGGVRFGAKLNVRPCADLRENVIIREIPEATHVCPGVPCQRIEDARGPRPIAARLARACYRMLREQRPVDVGRCFG